ncbi:MAG: ATP-binding cassette domain-containing protein [Phycisphaerae bacterium]|jgi:ATPase subunit of ABC transporter with duplicated ATPase domains
MSAAPLEFRSVTFTYDTAAQPVLADLSLCFPPGWTGVIGANGCGKTTLLRLATDELTPSAGRIIRPARVVCCPQRTDAPPEGLAALLRDDAPAAHTLRGRLGIEADWPGRWETLSHGERKRAQVGVVLWQEPDVLALDEPTNHIDAAARALLLAVLREFRGVGLLVSHDRELLDALCRSCLFMDRGRAVLRPGGYTAAITQQQAEDERARAMRDQARAEVRRIEREAHARRQEAARAHKLRSKRGIAAKDHDAKDAINRARLTGKDGAAGRKLRQMQGRAEQAAARVAEINVRGSVKMGVALGGERARRPVLLRLPEGEVPLGDGRMLVHPELEVRADARIALVGPNGSGKSTLVRHILERLDLPAERVVYLPQEMLATEGARLAGELRALPRAERGEALSHVSRLNSDPRAVLETELPSPGETRKIRLALGMAYAPHLIVLDEPTNHLDLPSIEALEAALAECPAALLLVSHDRVFLERLARTWWQIEADAGGGGTCLRIGPGRRATR